MADGLHWDLTCDLGTLEVEGKPATQIQVDGSLANWARVQVFLDAGIKPDICWRDAGGGNT